MKKNDRNRKQNLQALTAALDAGMTDAALRAVAGGMRADKTDTVTSAGVTRCCWG